MISEFEEKEYEVPLIHQLLQTSHNIWSPGQVFEGNLGIDTAILTLHRDIWKLLNSGNPLSGVVLEDYNFGYIWRKIRGKTKLPTFSLNLFLQIKRCERLTNRPSVLKQLGLRSPYWRFTITQHQQILLEKLDRKLMNKGIVAYAAPAFNLKSELYDFTSTNQLVNNSTFVKVSKLVNHHRWVYDSSGSSGYACSKPEKIEGINLNEEIKILIENNYQDNETNVDNNLKNLANTISELAFEIDDSKNQIAKELLKRFEQINELNIEMITKDYLKIKNFAYLTNSIWLPIY